MKIIISILAVLLLGDSCSQEIQSLDYDHVQHKCPPHTTAIRADQIVAVNKKDWPKVEAMSTTSEAKGYLHSVMRIVCSNGSVVYNIGDTKP